MRAGCCGRLDDRVKEFDARIEEIARRTPARRRLQAIPGIGPLTATAPSAAAPARPADRGRDFYSQSSQRVREGGSQSQSLQ